MEQKIPTEPGMIKPIDSEELFSFLGRLWSLQHQVVSTLVREFSSYFNFVPVAYSNLVISFIDIELGH
jgi:hypothetical protein